MYWISARDGDHAGYTLHRRHYSAKNHSPGIKQFVGPGEKMVLVGFMCNAVFAWRKAIYRGDGQIGVECSVFRNESAHRSSDMIREAMAIGWSRWPGERLFTMVDPKKVRSSNPGYCFIMAGWRKCGLTKRGLIVFEVQ